MKWIRMMQALLTMWCCLSLSSCSLFLWTNSGMNFDENNDTLIDTVNDLVVTNTDAVACSIAWCWGAFYFD